MDRATNPLWLRLDDFVRIVVAGFFVAIFSVGGVYLTPDLKTPAEWVSWLQLLIAVGIVSRKTMPLSAAGIIFLWVLALRDYDPFHLLDYLALGVARRGLPRARVLGPAGLAQAPVRGAALGRRHRADVVEPREVRLPGVVLPAGRRRSPS